MTAMRKRSKGLSWEELLLKLIGKDPGYALIAGKVS